MIETQAFVEQLTRDCQYRTPDQVSRSLTDKLLGRFDWWYYKGVMDIVTHGRKMRLNHTWNRETWQNLSLDIWRVVEGCGGRIEATGVEHLKGLDRPAVIVANHMSLLETFSIPATVLPFTHMTFVIKESLMKVPLFKHVMFAVDPIVVSRTNPREDMQVLMKQGPEVLAGGRSIVVFPQSTRSAVLDPSQFNSVAIKMAKRAGAPVIPLALKTDFHGLGRVIKDIGKVDRSKVVSFDFGPAMEVEGNGKATHKAVVDFIGSRLQMRGGEVKLLAESTSGSSE